MDFEHVITFVNGSERQLGLDSYNSSSTVCPAYAVLCRIKEPNGNPNEFVTKHALERYKKAKQSLERLGRSMVEVYSFGAVVGQFMVRPLLITLDEYAILCPENRKG